MVDLPILLIIHRRPDTTKRVLDVLNKMQPLQLFVAGDGPENNDQIESVKKTRALLNSYQFEGKVSTLYSDTNMGCRQRVITAIDWFFSKVDKGIILEDDTVPSTSFFQFCEVLLQRYSSNKNIFSVTGVSWLPDTYKINSDYYFSKYAGIWGWATWKNKWEKIHKSTSNFNEFEYKKKLKDVAYDETELKFHIQTVKDVLIGNVDSWGFLWRYTIIQNDGYCIVPCKNMVSNIGFDHRATHTVSTNSWKAARNKYQVAFPLNHPAKIQRDKKADKLTARRTMPYEKPLSERLVNLLRYIKQKF